MPRITKNTLFYRCRARLFAGIRCCQQEEGYITTQEATHSRCGLFLPCCVQKPPSACPCRAFFTSTPQSACFSVFPSSSSYKARHLQHAKTLMPLLRHVNCSHESSPVPRYSHISNHNMNKKQPVQKVMLPCGLPHTSARAWRVLCKYVLFLPSARAKDAMSHRSQHVTLTPRYCIAHHHTTCLRSQYQTMRPREQTAEEIPTTTPPDTH